jgi:hypothetical protein
LVYVNKGRAMRGLPPIESLPSFYDQPEYYDLADGVEDAAERMREAETWEL